ncbi:hypothetical protein GSI_12059 [Ganoderma sinense ZZ0214-1]|uniref:BTB domain-containing protein n=1 Tax=Ganoderma sinense ZZ0214-1 TaxID=1077348 RepID=A0A2G8RXQ9_9APHY|nr:hypothetical protein GSI_12059 [Ganoderma sinense ZZ0214-1]
MDELQADPEGMGGTQAGGQGQRERDAQFWYEDGTVILVAHNVEFRVYKGVLAQHSLFFRDMFSLPQPPNADGEVSCPIVPMSDSPEDVRHVLQACMIPGSPRLTGSELIMRISLFRREEPSFDLISACVRLGHKYHMGQLLGVSIAFLKSYYTTDLDTWQRHWATYDHGKCVQELPVGFTDLHAIGVVNLARLTGETSLLPTAFLQCHVLEDRVFDGFARPDGSHEGLQLADLKRCVKAKGRLAAASVAISVRIYLPSVSEGCTTRDACLAGFQLALALLDWYSDIVTRQDPFRPLLRLYEPPEGLPLCACCVNLAMERGKEAQEEFWKKLPEMFDIRVDGW